MASSQEMSTSEYIREVIESDITKENITKNQRYLYQTMEQIIGNLLDDRFEKYNQIIKTMFIKQELMIELIKSTAFANKPYDEEIKKFLESYTGDEILTTLL